MVVMVVTPVSSWVEHNQLHYSTHQNMAGLIQLSERCPFKDQQNRVLEYNHTEQRPSLSTQSTLMWTETVRHF